MLLIMTMSALAGAGPKQMVSIHCLSLTDLCPSRINMTEKYRHYKVSVPSRYPLIGGSIHGMHTSKLLYLTQIYVQNFRDI